VTRRLSKYEAAWRTRRANRDGMGNAAPAPITLSDADLEAMTAPSAQAAQAAPHASEHRMPKRK
jgi:hypothetical protein